MNSFWEKESLLHFDVIIIGGGITGISAAITVKEKSPSTSVAIFEAGSFHSGATTKNAGFACFGSITELLDDEQSMGTSKMLDLVEKRWNGLKKLIKRIGESNLDYHNYGGFELLFHPIDQAEIDRINQLLFPIFNQPVFSIKNQLIQQFGFDPRRVKQIIANPFEGQLDSGKMMNQLLRIAGSLDIRIFTNTMVNEIKSNIVETEAASYTCNQTVICTNAFTKQLLPTYELDLIPGRGQVLITKPIQNLKFKGVFHYDNGYFYFRNIGSRVLFGGGRNLAMKEEETTIIDLNFSIQNKLLEDLHSIILPSTPFEIDYQWAGIMAFGKDKYPIVKRINNQQTLAVKLGGMGIALGSLIGEEIAELTLEKIST